MTSKKFVLLACVLISFGIVFTGISQADWWISDGIITRVEKCPGSDGAKLRIIEGTTEYNYFLDPQNENVLLGLAIVAQAEGYLVDVQISGTTISRIRMKNE